MMTSIKRIAAFLVLVFALFSFSACKGSGTEYNKDDLANRIDDALRSGKTHLTVSYDSSSVSEDEIRSDLENITDNDYLASCLLKNADVSFDSGFSVTEAAFTLKYTDTGSFKGNIYDVKNRAQLMQTFEDIFAAGTTKAPVLFTGCSFSEEELFSLMNDAEINSAVSPCEATKLSYASYDSYGNEQLIIFQVEYPVGNAEMKKLRRELDASVSRKAEAISARTDIDGENPDSTEDLYRAVYDIIIDDVSYDDSISSQTISSSSRMPAGMHVDRSAYGALVTGNTVCTGYARGFKALCDELDLNCRVINGTKNGVPHAWNAVKIEDDLLYIDCTAADTGADKSLSFLFSAGYATSAGYVPENEDLALMWFD